MFRRNINTDRKRFNSSEDFSIITTMDTKNLHTTSYNGSLIVLCCLTHRLVFVTCKLIFVTRRLEFVTRRLVFVTRRLVFVTHRLVFVTRRVQSDHTSNSVRVLSSFYQVRHQQNYFFHNRHIFASWSTLIHKGRKLFA